MVNCQLSLVIGELLVVSSWLLFVVVPDVPWHVWYIGKREILTLNSEQEIGNFFLVPQVVLVHLVPRVLQIVLLVPDPQFPHKPKCFCKA